MMATTFLLHSHCLFQELINLGRVTAERGPEKRVTSHVVYVFDERCSVES